MCADPIDDAAELELLNTQIALANREKPEPRSPVCRAASHRWKVAATAVASAVKTMSGSCGRNVTGGRHEQVNVCG